MGDILNISESLSNFRSLMGGDSRRLHIQIPNAREAFVYSMKQFLYDKEFIWIPEYEEVVSWLTDNKMTGLALFGYNGRGKSLIARNVIPLIFFHYFNKAFRIYDAVEMNKYIDEILRYRMVVIDDIGTEDIFNEYGTKRCTLFELLDKSEKTNTFVILTSNLNKDMFIEKYGLRTFERLKATTTRVFFKKEESLRNQNIYTK